VEYKSPCEVVNIAAPKVMIYLNEYYDAKKQKRNNSFIPFY